MSDTRGKGVKLKRRPIEEKVEDVNPPAETRDIYQSVVRDLGFDPLKESAARRT